MNITIAPRIIGLTATLVLACGAVAPVAAQESLPVQDPVLSNLSVTSDPTQDPMVEEGAVAFDFVYRGQPYDLETGKEYRLTPELWTRGMTGEQVEFGDGAEFLLTEVTGDNFSASIDPVSGVITYHWAQGVAQGTEGDINVSVTLPSGLKLTTSKSVTLGEEEFPTEASKVQISYDSNSHIASPELGSVIEIAPSFIYLPDEIVTIAKKPDGVTAQLIKNPSDIDLTLIEETGALAVTFDEVPRDVWGYYFTVRYTFPDGSQQDVEGIITVENPAAEESEQPEETPAPTASMVPTVAAESTQDTAEPSVTPSSGNSAGTEVAQADPTPTAGSSDGESSPATRVSGNQTELAQTGSEAVMLIGSAGLLALVAGCALLVRRARF